jgi:hypothetical protein
LWKPPSGLDHAIVEFFAVNQASLSRALVFELNANNESLLSERINARKQFGSVFEKDIEQLRSSFWRHEQHVLHLSEWEPLEERPSNDFRC